MLDVDGLAECRRVQTSRQLARSIDWLGSHSRQHDLLPRHIRQIHWQGCDWQSSDSDRQTRSRKAMTQDSLIYIIGTGVCGSLTGAVVYLFHRFEQAKQTLVEHFDRQLTVVNSRLQDCETDREALRKSMFDLHRELVELKRRIA